MENNAKALNVSEMSLNEVQQMITTLKQDLRSLEARHNVLINIENVERTRRKAESLVGKCLSYSDGSCLMKICAINEVGNGWVKCRGVGVDRYSGDTEIRTNDYMYIEIGEFFDSNYKVIDSSEFISKYEKVKALCDERVGIG